MDLRLVNGDHSLDSRGYPIAVTGDEELIQQALIRLSVRRGSLPEDLSLGSGLYRLGAGSGNTLARLARGYVQEALLPMTRLTVESVEVTRRPGEQLYVDVRVSSKGRQYQLEVECT